MAAFTSIQMVGDCMERLGCRYWRVYDSDRNKINELMVVGRDDKPIDSYEKLSNFLAELRGDYVTVQIFTQAPNRGEEGENKPGNKVGQTKYTYRVHLGGNIYSPISGPMERDMQGGNTLLSERLIALEKALIEQKYQTEIAGLRNEIEDLKSGTTGGFEDKIFGLLEKYLLSDKIKRDLAPAPKGEQPKQEQDIAGTPESTGLIGGTVNAVSKAMKASSPEFFEAIKYYAETNPEAFKATAVSMIEAINSQRGANNEG